MVSSLLVRTRTVLVGFLIQETGSFVPCVMCGTTAHGSHVGEASHIDNACRSSRSSSSGWIVDGGGLAERVNAGAQKQ